MNNCTLKNLDKLAGNDKLLKGHKLLKYICVTRGGDNKFVVIISQVTHILKITLSILNIYNFICRNQ